MKYGSLTLGNIEALCNMCGGEESVNAIIRGEKKITVEEVIRLLVDKNGRCIKQPQVVSAVCDPNTSFHFDPLPNDFEFQPTGMDVEEFNSRIEVIKVKIAANPQVANLLKGVCYPIVLPQIPVDRDYGMLLQEILLPLVAKSYETAFPNRRFYNYSEGGLIGRVTIIDERHAMLVADLAKGPIVGILTFPLQGFSVDAQCEMAKLMPENISLAGAIEIAVVETMYFKFLSGDCKTLIKDCSAVQTSTRGFSLCFYADGGKFIFDRRGAFTHALSNSSGALFCRG